MVSITKSDYVKSRSRKTMQSFISLFVSFSCFLR